MFGRQARAGRGGTGLLVLAAIVCLLAGSVLTACGLGSGASPGAPIPAQTFDLAPDDVPSPLVAP